MSQVVIENPIINSPTDEPTRHFRFSDEGITDEIVDGRRTSSYFVPIAKPKKTGAKQLQFDTEWTQDRIEENKLVNEIRRRVALWRTGGYVGVTATTARLIAYWTDPNREKPLFFCQNEALETAVYIAEVAKKYGDAWIENTIRQANDTSNPGLPRTGSGRRNQGRSPVVPAAPLKPASAAWGQFPDRSPQFPVLSYAFPCSQVGKFPVRQEQGNGG